MSVIDPNAAARRRKFRDISVSVDVEVPVYDIMHQLEDEDLLDELAKRKLEQKTVEVEDQQNDLIDEALDYLRAGNVKDAILVLERTLHPKFSSLESCQSEFKRLIEARAGVSVASQDGSGQ